MFMTPYPCSVFHAVSGEKKPHPDFTRRLVEEAASEVLSPFSVGPSRPRDAQRDHRLARISLSSGVVHSADLVAMMGRGCFPREEMNATKRDLEVLRCKVHLVAQPVGLDASVESGHSFASI